MSRNRRLDLARTLLVLGAIAGAGGCAGLRLKRDIRRKDLKAVKAASPQVRARLAPKWRRRYAQLLAERGEVQAAQLWWLGSYLRGADLGALEALAVSHAQQGSIGFAAAQFSQVLATQRGALQDKALACRVWRTRKRARVQAGAYVSAQRDERRLRALCESTAPDPDLAMKAGVQRRARAAPPALIDAFAPALMPAFLDPSWQAARLGNRGAVHDTGHQDAPRVQGAQQAVARLLITSLLDAPDRSGPWLSGAPEVQTPMAGATLLAEIGRDPTLGPAAAGLCALLGAANQKQALSILEQNLRASSSLMSGPSARLRVILALVQGHREQAIFWMRLGASQASDLGAWWLWCARWARLTGQDAATKVAYQSLTKVVAPQSPARWTLSWWRLRHKIFELGVDPYLRADAPNTVARDSLRAFWDQFLASLPSERRAGVWPTLVDDLVVAGWDDPQIHRLGGILFGASDASDWRSDLLVSRAQLHLLRTQPLEALKLESPALRGEAWRQLWSTQGVNAASIARYWSLMEQDSAWSPSVDPFAALSVLFSRPQHWRGQH